jgi:serpin B
MNVIHGKEKQSNPGKYFRHRIKWYGVAASLVLIVAVAFIFSWFGNKSADALADVVFPKTYAYDDTETQQEIINGNPVDEIFLKALDDFSYQTAAQIFSDRSGNVNYSPLSLYYALAMAAFGAEGETADELLALLGMPDQTALSEQCGNLYRRLYVDNKVGKLQIGNSLWMDSGIVWKDDYIRRIAENFYADSFSKDFSDAQTGKLMAQWVSDRTDDMLNPTIAIDSGQVLSIINTIFFYDEWMNKFDKSLTAEDVFHPADSAEVNCEFMNKTYSSSGFSRGDGFTRSDIDFKNAGSMVFILPDEGVSPRDLLASPTSAKDVFENGEDSVGIVEWQIPKFDFGSSFDFADILQNLGISSAFQQDADFSGITDDTAYISDIHQETHIRIDENGVAAAAFTQLDYTTAAQPQGRADMILNRPFIYGITASNGTLLFVGICENPNEK